MPKKVSIFNPAALDDDKLQEILKKSGQSGAFIRAAKEIEADEDEEAFKRRLKRVADAKPQPQKK